MNIIGPMFKNKERADKFWNDSAYDIMDITVALQDYNLPKCAMNFALHFAEPKLMSIYTNF